MPQKKLSRFIIGLRLTFLSIFLFIAITIISYQRLDKNFDPLRYGDDPDIQPKGKHGQAFIPNLDSLGTKFPEEHILKFA